MRQQLLPDSDDECKCSRAQHELTELVMLRLDQQDQMITDRDARIADLEQRIAAHDAMNDEYMGAMQTVCCYLAETLDRLRAKS